MRAKQLKQGILLPDFFRDVWLRKLFRGLGKASVSFQCKHNFSKSYSKCMGKVFVQI